MKRVSTLLQIICISIMLIPQAFSQIPMYVTNSENVILVEKAGSEIFFFKYADSSGTWITQLWKTNTSASGATLVKTISSMAATLGGTKVINNKLFFVADKDLWVSDGTSNGTIILYASDFSVYSLFEFNSKLYFSVYGMQTTSRGMYVSDGTVGGTTMLKNFLTRGSQEDGVSNYVAFNNKIIFTTKKGDPYNPTTQYMEIWSTDGTAGGFVRLDSLNGDARRYAGGSGYNAKSQWLREYNGYLYFMFINANNYNADELWRTDGTVNNSAPYNGFGHPIIVYNGKLIQAGNPSNIGTELCSTDGATGTTLIKDINTASPGILGSNPSNFNTTCNKLFFLAADTGINVTNRERIYVTDGTTNGTLLYTAPRGSYSIFKQTNDIVYYAYTDNNNDSVKVYMIDTLTCSPVKLLSWANAEYGGVKQIVQLNPLFVALSGGSATNGQAGLFGLGLVASATEIANGSDSHLKLFPNPCTNNLQLEFADKNGSYQIINKLGQVVQSGLLTDNVIPTGNLSKGGYVLRITDSTLNTSSIGRFIKE